MSGAQVLAHWDIRHGSRWTYEQHGCRCNRCQAAWDAYQARKQRKARRTA